MTPSRNERRTLINDIPLARDRHTTLQEADGMRSSEDDLAALKEELAAARCVGPKETVAAISVERDQGRKERTG